MQTDIHKALSQVNAGLVQLAFVGFVALFSLRPATAQTTSDFAAAFAGQWITFSTQAAGTDFCRLTLSGTATGGVHAVQPTACAGPMAQVAAWQIAQSQMILISGTGAIIARLGGTETRLTGDIIADGAPIILEPAEAAIQTYQDRKSEKCYYLGYEKSCAAPAQFAPPDMGSTTAQISILMDLNSRAEPRQDAKVVAVLPARTCIAVDKCTHASDGWWCQADADRGNGWFKKQAIRQQTWPVVTFVNGCGD